MFVCRYVGISITFGFQVFFSFESARTNFRYFLGGFICFTQWIWQFGVIHWRIRFAVVAENQQNLQLLFLAKIPLLYNNLFQSEDQELTQRSRYYNDQRQLNARRTLRDESVYLNYKIHIFWQNSQNYIHSLFWPGKILLARTNF